MSADPPAISPDWLSTELFPFESHYARIDGASVHYVDEGSGPPLLLLHGNPTWSFLYRELIKGLSDRYRCIAPDHPGFGLSRAAPGYGDTPAEHAGVLERLVEQLDLNNVTMMVQDWGGPIGFAVATRHPDRFSAFVIGNTWAWPKGAAAGVSARHECSAGRGRPALLVWPTKDIAFKEPERARWEQLFPNHRTVILEGAGHYIQEDAADEIITAIQESGHPKP